MSTETNTTTEAAPASTTNEMPSPTQETPSSTVENLPQNDGDFATWLSDRLEKFEKGEEVAPWDQKIEPDEDKPAQEEVGEKETESDDSKEESEPAEDKKQEEAEIEEEDEDTKNMSASAGAKFKELKSELKTYKAKVAELEKMVEESKVAPQNNEELEKLRAQLTEYEQEIAITRVEATPEYKRAVLEPTEAILDTASSMAERYKLDPRKLVNALREESAAEGSDALTELAADFSERDRVRLYRMADDLSEVARRREYLRDNAAQAYAEQQEKARAEESKAEAAYKAETAKAAEQAWTETFMANGTLKSLDQAVLQEIKSVAAEADLLDASPTERAYAVYAGAALPHMVKQFEAASAKVSELEKALSKYKKAAPKVSGNTDTTPTIVDDGGFLDAIEKRFTMG